LTKKLKRLNIKKATLKNGVSMKKNESLIRLDPALLAKEAKDIRFFLESNIIDQRMGIERIVDAFSLSLSPLKRQDKPIFSGMFLGPSGVGKTKMAEMLAKFLIGQETGLTKIACAEYTEPHQISRLFGSPPGYVGFDDTREGGERNPPILSQEKINAPMVDVVLDKIRDSDPETKKIWNEIEVLDEQIEKVERILSENNDSNNEFTKKALRTFGLLKDQRARMLSRCNARINRLAQNMPIYSVVLFDEIEKAHPRILDALLEITDKAQATMGSGEKTHFNDSFVIMTSNIASVEIAGALAGKHSIGFGTSDIGNSIYDIAMRQLKKYLRPELIGRIKENIVVFNQLCPDSLKKIIDLQIRRLVRETMDRARVSIIVDKRVNEFIFQKACDHPEYGARLVEDKIYGHFAKPLSKLIGSRQVRFGDSIIVDVDLKNGCLTFLKRYSSIQTAISDTNPIKEFHSSVMPENKK
jgi:ATP-dependent Clp protease ATP-binding subunit ClpA